MVRASCPPKGTSAHYIIESHLWKKLLEHLTTNLFLTVLLCCSARMNKRKTVLTIFVTFWRERLGRDLKSKTELDVWWKERFNQKGDIVMSKVTVIIKGNFHQVGRVLKDCSVQWRVECPIVKNFCEKKERNSSRLEIFK